MDLTLNPMESGDFISRNSKHVKVNAEKCEEVAKKVLDSVIDDSLDKIDYCANPLCPQGLTAEQLCNWIYLLDTLNFSFWPNDGELYDVTYKDKKETGYLALCAAFCKAHDAGIDVTSTEWMSNCPPSTLDEILKSDSGHSIPLLESRAIAMHETADHLIKKYDGEAIEMVKKCNGSAQALLRAVIYIESFRDICFYKGKKVSFLKRAQILVSDVQSALSNNPQYADLVKFEDLGVLTMFADYRVPQVLNYFGALEYSEELTARLKTKEIISHHSEMEMEIRGCSIQAVQLIYLACERLREAEYGGLDWECLRFVYPIHIDIWLWQYRREHSEAVETHIPYHRTRSIFY
ncbi:hypothetical protein PFISCL1PPCAC_15792 [Pristionchus fissidentatus]|uniref:Queuosine 5'-phosphate N-glycosylase/hydrolase n=1 Tax=Pristionchus fissidentatus TaxID=1538716 RepID=A0AAV5W2D4_9BILA|nr:hypothetical protein PFISCL1PPCAC_15792 [Pristionchus fissidentatus]